MALTVTAPDLRQSVPDWPASIDQAVSQLRRQDEAFGAAFPDDTTVEGRYQPRPPDGDFAVGANRGWTTGFRTGLRWLAYDWSGDDFFRSGAASDVVDFTHRIEAGLDTDTHDLGFLYTLSCVAAARLTGDPVALRAGLAAADRLMSRICQPAGVVQAWGDLSDPAQRGRTIIDSLMNMPLLYWASQASGRPDYAAAAHRHASQLRDHIVRPDGSTFHTFYWDPTDGRPLGGATAQGHADDSCWARGQAWGVLGFALNFRYSQDDSFLVAAGRCLDYYLAHLPSDQVPYWDLVFGDGSGQPRDSSAAAIAACGLRELAGHQPGQAEALISRADAITGSLVTGYSHQTAPRSNALLLHGVYDLPKLVGVDEANLWGDYFYLEALLRAARPGWLGYW
ncbi:MAG: glycoside hydrolase family 88 protein [Propionibacteriaceae bacterium]|jgi:unsaturated chondroitin disaccharide hydrolase|nr:glycoside hydrolase family 88 protein [Propionibacteriaceae bacterium]